MDTILLIYTSMTGNTEAIADLIEAGAIESGLQVDRKEAIEIEANELLDYKAIIIGSYTWGDGDVPDEFLDIYEDLQNFDLTGRKFAIFGSGDTSYEHFCGAVDRLEASIKANGGEVVLEGLKVELLPEGEEEEKRCKQFGYNFMEKLSS